MVTNVTFVMFITTFFFQFHFGQYIFLFYCWILLSFKQEANFSAFDLLPVCRCPHRDRAPGSVIPQSSRDSCSRESTPQPSNPAAPLSAHSSKHTFCRHTKMASAPGWFKKNNKINIYMFIYTRESVKRFRRLIRTVSLNVIVVRCIQKLAIVRGIDTEAFVSYTSFRRPAIRAPSVNGYHQVSFHKSHLSHPSDTIMSVVYLSKNIERRLPFVIGVGRLVFVSSPVASWPASDAVATEARQAVRRKSSEINVDVDSNVHSFWFVTDYSSYNQTTAQQG